MKLPGCCRPRSSLSCHEMLLLQKLARASCIISLASHRAPIITIRSFGSPVLLSSTLTCRSCWQLSLGSLAAADGVALMQAFGVISRLHRPSVAALLAKDLVAEWLPIRKFEQPGGVWVTHVLPAVLSFLGDSLEDVLMLPDQALPEAQSILKVCPDVQNLQLQLLSSSSVMCCLGIVLRRACQLHLAPASQVA